MLKSIQRTAKKFDREHFRSEADLTNCGLSIRLLCQGCAVLGPCFVPRRRAKVFASIEIIKKQLKIFE
ncbi:hypothetical protein A6U90_18515 [Agrobacterium tumefaciens]|uniref:Uncharacterized protein n=1 Tax=Agrobacterium tumefaciens TaxID=358 RepID=A0A2Z2PLC7_AGRTU|nr:hypothetical protein [Agrobacterium tumefaciens]ASK42782.1 hypothetical protein [Agrobacterium sp.]ASK47077.1 hypothetical protein [Agrobacterium radiobacter]MQB27412.1 hypothetical protein [Agrobacterium tumefaciens]OCJ40128.1 hypothetical protein A6U90_18515 [Agrobacterium tumefaciens]